MLAPEIIEQAAALADTLAYEAGAAIRAGLDTRTVSFKHDGTEVTDVDVAINARVLAAVHQTFPDHQVLGEETSGTITDIDRPTWVVDPIDGTLSFAAGIGLACFSLALVVEGTPIVAAVQDPWTGLHWRGIHGRGAWRNGRRCGTSPFGSLVGARIDVEADVEYAAVSGALRDRGAVAICQWATVRTACAVADGAFHACLYGHGSPWDIAATTLLVREAGGVAERIDGVPVHGAGPSGRWLAAGSQGMWDNVADVWAATL